MDNNKKILLKETLRGAAKGALKGGATAAMSSGAYSFAKGLGRADASSDILSKFEPGVRYKGEGWGNTNIDIEDRFKIQQYLAEKAQKERNDVSRNALNSAKYTGILGAAFGAIKGGRKSYKETKKRLADEKDMQVNVDDGKDIKIAKLIFPKDR